MKQAHIVGLTATIAAGTAATQPDLLVSLSPLGGSLDEWRISAELLTTPTNPIIQIWADASFRIVGDGSPIEITSYNSSYDSTLGNAIITDNGSASPMFVGNANSFFGTPDSSNPLEVLQFTYTGFTGALCIELVGQNSAIFDMPPFGDVQLYQDAGGNPGPLSLEVFCIPSPGTTPAIALAALTAVHRRRGKRNTP
ncbi:MAG: hypothetical protein AAF937_06220 [Planctomycetota bacterium]